MSTKPVRVLACCGGMVVPGGLERMVLDLLRILRRHRLAVHCVVNSWSPDLVRDAASAMGASWSSGSYRHKFERRPANPLSYFTFLVEILRTSAGLLRDASRFRPTHVLVPEYAVVIRNWPALMLLRLTGRRVVLWVHSEPETTRLHRRLWRWLIDPAVDQHVCVSRSCRSLVMAAGVPARKTTVIYNFAPAARPATAAPVARDYASVLFVGQIIPDKGVDLLLEAVGQLVAEGRQVRLRLAGADQGWATPAVQEYRDELRKRAAAPDLHGIVEWLGQRDDVPALLAAAGVHCLPSRREGFGVVVIEAKQAGVPSVCFKTGPFAELIAHGETGFLCETISASALAEGLEYFLREGAALERRAAAIRASAAAFSEQRFEAAWLGLLGVSPNDIRVDARPAA